MRNSFLYCIFLITLLILSTIQGVSCSTFMLKNNKQLLVGRNLDTPVDLNGYLCVNKQGEMRYPLSLPIPNCHSRPWKVNYGSVTFTALGKGFSDGGMNEKGLVIEEMSLPSAEFLIDTNHTYLTSPQWIQYQLDNFATVDEVLANLSNILPVGWVWHFFVADRHGNAASIEFINGKLICHKGKDLSITALSNSEYSKSLNSLSRYKGFGGDEEIRQRLKQQSNQDNSLTRFAIVAKAIKGFEHFTKPTAEGYAFDLLSRIAGPKGFAKRSIVYDINARTVYFRTNGNENMRSLRFKDIHFAKDNLFIDLNTTCHGDIVDQLKVSSVKSDLKLHKELESLLLKFFKPNDHFPNLGVPIKIYLDRTAAHHRKYSI